MDLIDFTGIWSMTSNEEAPEPAAAPPRDIQFGRHYGITMSRRQGE